MEAIYVSWLSYETRTTKPWWIAKKVHETIQWMFPPSFYSFLLWFILTNTGLILQVGRCRKNFVGLQYDPIWVCLKIGYIPNYSHLIGIMISKTIGFRGLAYFQTNPYGSVLWKITEYFRWPSLKPLEPGPKPRYFQLLQEVLHLQGNLHWRIPRVELSRQHVKTWQLQCEKQDMCCWC